MSEIKKHIESILPEHAADELERMLVGDADATATAALTRLLHDWTGCDIPQTSDLPASEVEELVPLCVSILRRHWQTHLTCLGDGSTQMSLADLLRQTIGDRVQGNEALGIPAANANLPTAVAALTKRHIDDGLTITLEDGTTMPCPDGLSLAQLLCTGLADKVTEIVDNNRGWVMSKSINLGTFTNIKHITIRAKTIDLNNSILYSGATSVHINLPNATYIYATFTKDNSEIYAPEVESLYQLNGYGEAPQGEIVYMPKLRKVNCNNHYFRWFARDTELPTRKMVFGSLQGPYGLNNWGNCTSPNLIHLEFGADGLEGLAISMDTSTWWVPSAETLANPEFLSNFKTYIAERLTDKVSGLTLTLSQAVRDAIQGDPEIVSIITSKGWTISPAPSV